MTSQQQRDDEHNPHNQLESPGKRLRIARQAKGLTQQDVAAQLHLSSSIIQALEDDDHDRLPGPVFIRGYLRNYARMLDLEDKAVTGAYDGSGGDSSSTPLSVSSGVKPEIRSSHFGIRLMTWLIVLALVGLLAAWWMGRLQWPMDGAAPAPQPAATVVDEQGGLLLPEQEKPSQPEPPKIQPSEPNSGRDSYTPPAEPMDGQRSDAEAATGQPTAEEVDTATEDSTPVEPQSAEDTVEAPAPAPTPNTVASATADEPAERPAEQGEVPAAGGNTVVFEFIGSCWVDIRDSTRTFKVFGEMKKGERRELAGTPPYSVILGNSPMVRVTVGGVPYDVEAHSHGNVARFSLDPTAIQ